MTDYRLSRTPFIAALLGLFILPIHPALAETVEARLPSGIVATADFRAGQPSLPAILTLHGFLQTRNTQPMNAQGNILTDQGYTVLSPTLTLNINRRSKSLGCEAAHTHTKDDAAAEINFWTNWLARKGYKRVILLGHSSGGIQILQYITQKPSPVVRQAILVSAIELAFRPEESQATADRVKSGLISGKALERFTLGYCNKNYVSLPAAYLSYVADDNKIFGQLGKAKVPVEVILGGADRTMKADWPEQIRARGIPVTIINGANHFFDGAHEFDLADKVEAILKASPTGNK